VLDLLGPSAEDNIRIFEELAGAGGDVDEGFGILQETTEFKLKQALAGVEVAAVELADTLSPYVTRALEWLNEKIQVLITWWQGLEAKEKENIINWIGVVAALGPVLIVLGKTISTIYYLIKVILCYI